MLSTYLLKSRFQSVLRPLAVRLYRAGVTANQITIGACLMSLALGAAAIALPDRNYLFLLISFWCLLRMVANALDGMLAREYGQATPQGAVLNEVGDVVSDIALYLPFAFVASSHPWRVVAVVLLAVFIEIAGQLSAAHGRDRGYQGPMGNSDRALVFGIAGLLIGWGMPFGGYLNGLWALVAVLLVITIFNRCRAAVQPQGKP